MIKNNNRVGKYVLGLLLILILTSGCSGSKKPTFFSSPVVPTGVEDMIYHATQGSIQVTLESIQSTQTEIARVLLIPTKISTRYSTQAAPTSTKTVKPSSTPKASSTKKPTRTLTPTPTFTLTPLPTPTAVAVTLNPSNPQNNPTFLENIKPGTSDWMVNNGFKLNLADSQIAGFADATSVNIGESIHFAISTRITDTLYSLTVYRMGWYDKSGARTVLQKFGLKGQPQGYWDPNTKGVLSCPTCEFDPQTGLIDTHWTYNYTVTVPTEWVSGLYLVKLVDEKNYTAYVPFVVRDDSRQSDILVQIPFITY